MVHFEDQTISAVLTLISLLVIFWLTIANYRIDIFRFFKRKSIKAISKPKKKVNIDYELKNRIIHPADNTGRLIISNSPVDFKITNVLTDPGEYFDYFIQGLGYPEIADPVITKMSDRNSYYIHLYVFDSSSSKNFSTHIYFWGHYKENSDKFMMGLYDAIMKYDSRDYDGVEDSIETIIKRARGEDIDLIDKYGYMWR